MQRTMELVAFLLLVGVPSVCPSLSPPPSPPPSPMLLHSSLCACLCAEMMIEYASHFLEAVAALAKELISP